MKTIQEKASEYAQVYKSELLNSVLPFWLKYSKDEKDGGFFTCLTREGAVFDTDKFMWLQAREAWTFSMLYQRFAPNPEYLAFAAHGIEFLKNHGRNEQGDWFFSLTKEGKPLVQAYNIFSDCFASMAFGQFALASQKEEYATIAQETFSRILQRQTNPKGTYNKAFPGTRPLKNFALPMILCNLSLELEDLLEKEFVEETIESCIQEVMVNFYDDTSGFILENISLEGKLSDTFPGRLLNPGHAIEAMWFVMDLGRRKNDQVLINNAKDRMLAMLEYGWDQKHGGIFYFLDRKGYPTEQLEWDQKLWWVHLETLIALLKGYELTQDPTCWKWFERVHAYSWSKFPDHEHGEWYGYLNRQGDVLLPLKGGKWKGCFHVPRALFQCIQVLEKLTI